MATVIERRFIKTNSSDAAVHVGSELHSNLHRRIPDGGLRSQVAEDRDTVIAVVFVRLNVAGVATPATEAVTL
jgi:hypothetical protein